MTDTFAARYDAVRSKDPRFDGLFYTAVTTTGIFCRPSCPARTPHAGNVTFYPTAVEAASAGFRACRRCRPEASPGSPEWNLRSGLVDRALRLISDGVADDGGVAAVARRLDVSDRHLNRVMTAELGVGAAAYARARRAQSARLLLDSSDLPITTVAYAAGFSSVRQFNETMLAIYGCPPSELRRRRSKTQPAVAGELVLRLDYRPPLAAQHLIEFVRFHAIKGIEDCRDGTYRRTLSLPHGAGIVALTPAADAAHIVVRLTLVDLRDLTAAVQACRRMFDLDADPLAVGDTLGRDQVLAPLMGRTPGLRVPGAAGGFELAVRAVLGQQVTVQGACTLAGRLVDKLGATLPSQDGVLTHTFPAAAAVAGDDLVGIGLTGARVRAVRALATAVAAGTLDLHPGADRESTRHALLALPGVGEWTADYIAMRALADPDAFPHGDLGLRNVWRDLSGSEGPELVVRSRQWQPWRAYAAVYLWDAYLRATNTPRTTPPAR